MSNELTNNGPLFISRNFPYELKLLILDHIFDFPRGLYSNRFWPILYKCRVEPIIKTYPNLALALPEALYTKRPVIIELDTNPSAAFKIAYPKPAINQLVRQLEIHVSMWQYKAWGRPYTDYKYERNHGWLKRLSRGELGFENVELLRLVFSDTITASHKGDGLMDDQERLNAAKVLLAQPMSFRANKLEIVTPEHRRGGNLFLELVKENVTVRQN